MGPRSVSHVGIFKEVTKWSGLVTEPDNVPEVMRRAFRIMLTGRKGPVHIDLVQDVIRAEIDAELQPPRREIQVCQWVRNPRDCHGSEETKVYRRALA